MTDKVFLTPLQIAEIVYRDLSEESTEEIRRVDSDEGMIVFHFGAGQYIRNTFKLWDEDNPHTMKALSETTTTDAEKACSPYHPDQVSHEILKTVWRMVQGERGPIVMKHTDINIGACYPGTNDLIPAEEKPKGLIKFTVSVASQQDLIDAMTIMKKNYEMVPAEAPDAEFIIYKGVLMEDCVPVERVRPLPPLPPADVILEANGLPTKTFESELTDLINRYSLEGDSDTPDHILAAYMRGALNTFTQAVRARDDWYGHKPWGAEHGTDFEPLYTATEAPHVSS